MVKVAAAGGGTGGHLYPLLAILERMAELENVEVLYFVVSGKIDERVVKKEHPEYKVVPLNVRGLLRPLYHPKNFVNALKMWYSTQVVRNALRDFKPDAIVLSGGYVSAVVAFAAKDLRIPIYLQEQNVTPGLANKFSAKFARKVFLSFEKSVERFPENLRDKLVVTGLPIREANSGEKPPFEDFVLVLGGSLGSDVINSLMEKVYEMRKDLFFVHSTGNKEWCERLKRFPHVKAYEYIENTSVFWKRAKAVVARAGAATIGEMVYHGVRGVLIPWEGAAESHQLENAREAERMGYAVVLRESEATPEKVVCAVDEVLKKGKVVSTRENPAITIAKTILEEIR